MKSIVRITNGYSNIKFAFENDAEAISFAKLAREKMMEIVEEGKSKESSVIVEFIMEDNING